MPADLTLKTVRVKGWHYPLRIFSHPYRAKEHLCDHVLSRPEAYVWQLLIPSYNILVAPNRSDFALAVVNGPLPDEAQQLYIEYAQQIAVALGDAVCFALLWERQTADGKQQQGLGLNGVLVGWVPRKYLTTAHLSEFGSQHISWPCPPVEAARRRTDPLPRDRKQALNPVELLRDKELVSYLLFVGSLRRVRRTVNSAFQDPERQYRPKGRLKAFIAGHEPNWNAWQQMCQERVPGQAELQ